jgi:hypothetical protein
MHEFQALAGDLHTQTRYAGKISSWSRQAVNHTERDGVATHLEDDRNGRSCRLRRECDLCTTRRNNHCHRIVDQLPRELWQPTILAIGPPERDSNIASLDITGIRQTFPECGEATAVAFGAFGSEISDDRHRLATRGQYPSRGPSEECDEIASSHSKSGVRKGSRHEAQPRLSW